METLSRRYPNALPSFLLMEDKNYQTDLQVIVLDKHLFDILLIKPVIKGSTGIRKITLERRTFELLLTEKDKSVKEKFKNENFSTNNTLKKSFFSQPMLISIRKREKSILTWIKVEIPN
ncbi:MAG: hypothetical protein M0T81_02005 [Thermoplasmatales archaeon]|nr:hypothetical protein [Thermoplasmatales archaeon]